MYVWESEKVSKSEWERERERVKEWEREREWVREREREWEREREREHAYRFRVVEILLHELKARAHCLHLVRQFLPVLLRGQLDVGCLRSVVSAHRAGIIGQFNADRSNSNSNRKATAKRRVDDAATNKWVVIVRRTYLNLCRRRPFSACSSRTRASSSRRFCDSCSNSLITLVAVARD